MARYQHILDSYYIEDTQTGFTIPDDPANADFHDYLLWQLDGNTPDPPAQVTLPEIFALVNLSKKHKNKLSDPILFTAMLAATNDLEAATLPVTMDWCIELYHKRTGQRDSFLAQFVDGAIEYEYEAFTTQDLGIWVLDPETFSTVTVGEQEYQVTLVGYLDGVATTGGTLEFTLYRELAKP